MSDRSSLSDTQRWQAVCERDGSADGQFVYAVTSTGVFCRPSCRSRRPNRQNVRFFPDGRAARQAGFRPCLRCLPEIPAPGDRLAARIARVCRLIEQSDELPPLARLAESAGLSPWHFHRQFKKLVGLTPRQYAARHRQQRFRKNLAAQQPVTAALYEAGYGSSSRAYAAAGGDLGMSPAIYRKGAEGLLIHYALAPCTLGWVLVAATSRGLCCIDLDDTPEPLPARLRQEFPRAELEPAGSDFTATVAAVVALIETPAAGHSLPLDIRGTALQVRVWEALRQIPAGTTLSYGELAARLGKPGAARAVASACARNRLAVAIPCHRVVGGDGNLRGYRWGLERKQELLKRETDPS